MISCHNCSWYFNKLIINPCQHCNIDFSNHSSKTIEIEEYPILKGSKKYE